MCIELRPGRLSETGYVHRIANHVTSCATDFEGLVDNVFDSYTTSKSGRGLYNKPVYWAVTTPGLYLNRPRVIRDFCCADPLPTCCRMQLVPPGLLCGQCWLTTVVGAAEATGGHGRVLVQLASNKNKQPVSDLDSALSLPRLPTAVDSGKATLLSICPANKPLSGAALSVLAPCNP